MRKESPDRRYPHKGRVTNQEVAAWPPASADIGARHRDHFKHRVEDLKDSAAENEGDRTRMCVSDVLWYEAGGRVSEQLPAA